MGAVKSRYEYQKSWALANKERRKILRRKRYEENKDSALKQCAQWRKENAETKKLSSAKYRENNIEAIRKAHRVRAASRRVEAAKAAKEWRLKNRGRYNSISARRRAKKKLAHVKWANEFFISEIYGLAQLRTRLLGFGSVSV